MYWPQSQLAEHCTLLSHCLWLINVLLHFNYPGVADRFGQSPFLERGSQLCFLIDMTTWYRTCASTFKHRPPTAPRMMSGTEGMKRQQAIMKRKIMSRFTAIQCPSKCMKDACINSITFTSSHYAFKHCIIPNLQACETIIIIISLRRGGGGCLMVVVNRSSAWWATWMRLLLLQSCRGTVCQSRQCWHGLLIRQAYLCMVCLVIGVINTDHV